MPYDHLFKILVIGDTFVGKTAITNRLLDNQFVDRYIETIGIDFKIRTIQLDGLTIRLQVWDTAGIERLNTVTPAYYSHAVGIVLVFSLIDKETFQRVPSWYEIIDEFASENVEKVLVGNKSDLDDYRQVYHNEARHVAALNRSMYFETSAKLNYNIMQTFMALSRRILSNHNLTPFTSFRPLADCQMLVSPTSLQQCHRDKRNRHKHHENACCYIS